MLSQPSQQEAPTATECSVAGRPVLFRASQDLGSSLLRSPRREAVVFVVSRTTGGCRSHGDLFHLPELGLVTHMEAIAVVEHRSRSLGFHEATNCVVSQGAFVCCCNQVPPLVVDIFDLTDVTERLSQITRCSNDHFFFTGAFFVGKRPGFVKALSDHGLFVPSTAS